MVADHRPNNVLNALRRCREEFLQKARASQIVGQHHEYLITRTESEGSLSLKPCQENPGDSCSLGMVPASTEDGELHKQGQGEKENTGVLSGVLSPEKGTEQAQTAVEMHVLEASGTGQTGRGRGGLEERKASEREEWRSLQVQVSVEVVEENNADKEPKMTTTSEV